MNPFILLQFFAKAISEDIWGHLQKKIRLQTTLTPQNNKITNNHQKKVERASLDILKALMLTIFSPFFQVGLVQTSPKKSFFLQKYFFLEFLL